MDDIIMRTFPANDAEALAMLYVQSQDLSGLTVEDLVDMYDSAYETISAIRAQQCNDSVEWI